jgi:glyoxylase-like metal-dependent hydrolase (beta-lactamase superfamily II)
MRGVTDTYTGEVSGGPAQTRQLAKLEITKVSVGPMDNNAYLLRCRQTGDALLVDAANDADTLLALLAEHTNGRLNTAFTTHQHFDHWQALGAVVSATGATTAAGRADAPELPVAVDVPLDDGDELAVGECTLTAIHLVGHTPGSIALAYKDPEGHQHIFTGDSLFPGGVGKTWQPGDFTSLLHDVRTKIFDRFDDDTWIYPGHGNDTTLGVERPHLDEWQERGW